MSNITITSDNLSTVARSMIVDGRRVASQYDAMIQFYSLTVDSASGDVTEAARAIVLAAYPDTDPDRLAGKNKNDDLRWKDARAVRIGLVAAIKRTIEEDENAAPKESVLRVSLSGEGGKSATVDMDSALGEAILAFLALP